MARRSPDRLTPYLCLFCADRIPWGVIVRILASDPGRPAWEQREIYAHLSCLRAALSPRAALDFVGAAAPADRCGLCDLPLARRESVNLRLQRPTGTVRRPTFDTQTVAVHRACLDAGAGHGVNRAGSTG